MRARKDNNGIPVMLGTSSVDGVTPIVLYVEPNNHGIEVDDNTTGSDLSAINARRDENYDPVAMGTSSSDGLTPEAIYIEPTTKKLLINSL